MTKGIVLWAVRCLINRSIAYYDAHPDLHDCLAGRYDELYQAIADAFNWR